MKAYRPGDWRAICDVCGFEYYGSQLHRRWDGLYVCYADWEPRHPQDYVKGVRDRQRVPFSRPDPDAVYIDRGTIFLDGSDAIAESAEGVLVGTLSITTGSADFVLLDDADGKFKLDPSDTTRLLTGPVPIDAGDSSLSITVAAIWQGPLGTDFTISVTAASGEGSPIGLLLVLTKAS